MSRYELDARYDARKSFYGKAMVEEGVTDDNNPRDVVRLYSYGTLVAEVVDGYGAKAYELATCSPTTVRHVREFFRQFCRSLGHDIPIAKIRKIQAQTVADGEPGE